MLDNIEQAVSAAQADVSVAGSSGGGSPSNQEILDRSKQAYRDCQASVDASARALAQVINAGSLQQAITTLDGTNWGSTGVTEKLVEPVFASPDIDSAVQAAARPLVSYSVGVFSNDLPDRRVGVIGFARSLTGRTTRQTVLSLNIFSSVVEAESGRNLQLGQWVRDPEDLHDQVYGLYLQATVSGVTMDLKIVLDTSLQPYGFVESTGAAVKLPVKSSPFGGSTAVL